MYMVYALVIGLVVLSVLLIRRERRARANGVFRTGPISAGADSNEAATAEGMAGLRPGDAAHRPFSSGP